MSALNQLKLHWRTSANRAIALSRKRRKVEEHFGACSISHDYANARIISSKRPMLQRYCAGDDLSVLTSYSRGASLLKWITSPPTCSVASHVILMAAFTL